MKAVLEETDIEVIAQRVVELLKPMLSGNVKQDNEDRIFNKKQLAKYLGVDVSWIDKRVSYNEIPFRSLVNMSGLRNQ